MHTYIAIPGPGMRPGGKSHMSHIDHLQPELLKPKKELRMAAE